MSPVALLKASGVSALACGALTAVFWLLHPAAGDPKAPKDPAYYEAVASGRFQGVNALFVLVLVLSLLALLGFYFRQREASGALGMIGFVLGFIGTALFIGAGVFSAFVAPVLAASEATRPLLDEKGPLLGGPMAGLFAGSGLLFALGYVLFGVATFRAAVLPKWAGLLLVASSPILGLSPLMPLIAREIGSAVFGVANIWLGLANLKARPPS
ncbi:MAG: hypothetical protein HYZ28_18475 [Myxococcales bacterium]|nr:hypothetical protein [Myxococcales bacterium]